MAYKRSPLRRNPVLRVAILCAAVVCLILGAIILPLPIPFGLALLVLGFALLLMSSRRTKVWFRGVRRGTPWLDRKLATVEHRLPDELRRALSGRPGGGVSSS